MLGLRVFALPDPRAVTDVVKMERDTGATRARGTIAAGAGTMELGRVLGILTASGKWTNYTPGATDGSQFAASVLLADAVDATATDQPDVQLLVRGPASVAVQELTWGAGVTTQSHKNAAIAALRALGILSAIEY